MVGSRIRSAFRGFSLFGPSLSTFASEVSGRVCCPPALRPEFVPVSRFGRLPVCAFCRLTLVAPLEVSPRRFRFFRSFDRILLSLVATYGYPHVCWQVP